MTPKQLLNVLLKVLGVYIATLALYHFVSAISNFLSYSVNISSQLSLIGSSIGYFITYALVSIFLIYKSDVLTDRLLTKKAKDDKSENLDSNMSVKASNNLLNREDLVNIAFGIIGIILITFSISNILSSIFPIYMMAEDNYNNYFWLGFFSQIFYPITKFILGVLLIQKPAWLSKIILK